MPANGQVPIEAEFDASEQFVLYWDAADTNLRDCSGQVTIV